MVDFYDAPFSDILPILLAETIIYSGLLLTVFVCSLKLKALHLLHTTYRLFTLSVILQWIGAMVQAIAYTIYALSGIPPRAVAGGLLMGGSEVTFLGLVLLMAKGYTITRARLSSSSMMKLAMFLNAYIIAYISLYIFQIAVS